MKSYSSISHTVREPKRTRTINLKKKLNNNNDDTRLQTPEATKQCRRVA